MEQPNPHATEQLQQIAIDLNPTPIIMKAVTALVNMNTDIPLEHNALMLAAAQGMYVPLILQGED